MAKHVFDGTWRFYFVDDRNYPPGKPLKSALKLVIPDANTGKIETGSAHNKPNDMSGNATKDAEHIEMREQDPQNGLDLSYNGHRLHMAENDDCIVVVGTWVDNTRAPAVKRMRAFTDGQNDGTWVMTKP